MMVSAWLSHISVYESLIKTAQHSWDSENWSESKYVQERKCEWDEIFWILIRVFDSASGIFLCHLLLLSDV